MMRLKAILVVWLSRTIVCSIHCAALDDTTQDEMFVGELLRKLTRKHERRRYRKRKSGRQEKRVRVRQDGLPINTTINEQLSANATSRSEDNSTRRDETMEMQLDTRIWHVHKPGSKSYSEYREGKGIRHEERSKKTAGRGKASRGGNTVGKGKGRPPGKGEKPGKRNECKNYSFYVTTVNSKGDDKEFRNIFDRERPEKEGRQGSKAKDRIRGIFDRDLFFARDEAIREIQQKRTPLSTVSTGSTSEELCDPNVLEKASKNPKFSTFVRLIEHAGLQDIFGCPGPFTLFAPTNDAFKKLHQNIVGQMLGRQSRETLRDILLYHILPNHYNSNTFQPGFYTSIQGESVSITLRPLKVNNEGIGEADISACNGIIHAIDDFLVPPSIAEDFGSEAGQTCSNYNFGGIADELEGERCNPNVLQVARGDATLSLFVSLIEKSGLEDIFQCAGPFTVLVPTNDAILQMESPSIEFLIRPENGDYLTNFVLYHVLSGRQLTNTLKNGQLVSLQGSFVEVNVDPVTFNGVQVVEFDIEACNGIIEKLENILLSPASPNIFPTRAPTSLTAPPTGAPIAASTLSPVGFGGTEAPVLVATIPPAAIPGTLSPTDSGPSSLSPTLEDDIMRTTMPTQSNFPGLTVAPTFDSTETITPSTSGSQEVTIVPSTEGTSMDGTSSPTQSSSPTDDAPTTTPTEKLVRVRVRDYYISYVVPFLTEEPSMEAIDQLFEVTTQFWTKVFADYYDGSDVQFRGLALTVVNAQFGAGIPEPSFNFLIEWDTVILYELDTPDFLSATQTFGIMTEADLIDYILNYVRTVPEFVSTNEVDFKAIERIELQTDFK